MDMPIKEIVDLARDHSLVDTLLVTEPTIRDQPIPLLRRPDGDGGVSVESLKSKLDEWRIAPERRVGTATMLTLESLIAFVNRHKDADSALFANIDASVPTLGAVFDYHKTDLSPRYGKHRVNYAFPLSQEWKAWKAMDGKSMKQGDWAAFIEDRIADLSAPFDQERTDYERTFQTKIATPAELITLSRGLQITIESKVGDFRTLQSGEVEISYSEVHKDGRGEKLVVPGLFVINVPLFVDAEPTRILARLRYRKSEGAIVWFYQLYRADAEVREAMRQDVEKVVREASLPMFEGWPEVI